MSRITKLTNDFETDVDQNITFVIEGEGHSLGNLLKNVISSYSDVSFCGYTVPHILDNKINLKIQTYGDVKAVDVLRRGLQDAAFICDHILNESELAMK